MLLDRTNSYLYFSLKSDENSQSYIKKKFNLFNFIPFQLTLYIFSPLATHMEHHFNHSNTPTRSHQHHNTFHSHQFFNSDPLSHSFLSVVPMALYHSSFQIYFLLWLFLLFLFFFILLRSYSASFGCLTFNFWLLFYSSKNIAIVKISIASQTVKLVLIQLLYKWMLRSWFTYYRWECIKFVEHLG